MEVIQKTGRNGWLIIVEEQKRAYCFRPNIDHEVPDYTEKVVKKSSQPGEEDSALMKSEDRAS